MLLIHNFARFPESWTASTGETGQSVAAPAFADFHRLRREPGAVHVVNCDVTLTLELAAARLVPGHHPPLVAVDLVLRVPTRPRDRMSLPVKRAVLSNVDLFLHYFRDFTGIERTFGIGPDRSEFVPFKANLIDRGVPPVAPGPGGDYALCLGRSLRDFDTFFDAVETLPYPAAIPRPDFAELARHGARFARPLDRLPANVRVLDDDGSDHSLRRLLEGARLVVLPILPTSIVASGISTCLNALLLGKCVIGSEGPGMSDIFAGEVLTVPPADARALGAAIRRAWEDEALRIRTAALGQAFALAAGGSAKLYQRVIDRVAASSRIRQKLAWLG